MKHLLNGNYVWMAILLVGLGGCAGTSTSDSTGEYIDDATITTKVKTALINDPNVSALHISVETFKGAVHLTGTAETRDEANKATALARKVAGVKAVNNDIVVK